MMHFFFSVLLLVLACPLLSDGSEIAPNAEIEQLIRIVETSDVRFIRNGRKYSAAEAGSHMRRKLARAGDRVKTSEDFLTGIASKSFLTGNPYSVELPSGKILPTGEWLREHLVKIRAAKRE